MKGFTQLKLKLFGKESGKNDESVKVSGITDVIAPSADAAESGTNAMENGESLCKNDQEPVAKIREDVIELDGVVSYDYLEGDTGFLAIKDSFDRCYADDGNPEFLYYQDVDNLRDEYDLFHNDYDYSLYEFMMVYDADDSWHIASLGLSNMTAEVDTIDERYDAEYTMRIKKLDDEELDSAERANAINLVSVLADEALKNDCMLEDYSYVNVGHEEGMDYKHLSDKVAFIIVPDARIGSVEGPFGTVHLRQAVPITKAEYDALKSKKIEVKTLYEKIGTDLVDYDRPSVI